MERTPDLCAVVFDLDGLMFNTEDLYQEVGSQILRRRGREFTQDLLDQMMGRPSPVALQLMIDWHGLDDTVADLEAETDELFPAILDAHLAPMPGFLALMEFLESQGLPKGVATSSRRAFVEDVLTRFSLQPRFEFVLTAEDVRQGKPNPEIYQTAARRLGFATSRVMVLEDSENGCRAAVAAGAYAVAVPGAHSRDHDFTGAAFVASSLEDARIFHALENRG
jgi:HAD superfamily hydrolase (TIGR01509 family)